MNKMSKKLIIIFSIAIAIFTIGIVYKEFQNDTFFNIAIGKQLLEDGIDMKEHFCWVNDDLDYTHSHWIFDIITYLIYNNWGFTGIYVSVIIVSIIIGIAFFILSTKLYKSPIVSFLITIVSMYIIKDAFTARSQIVSFLCFILEIYCLEQLVNTNKKKYAIYIIIQSIIIANFHAATWPLVLVLFLPYIAAGILNTFSSKNIYRLCIKNLERKIKKCPTDSSKIEEYKKDIADYERIIQEPKGEFSEYKVIRKKEYHLKTLIILFIIISFTGLLTPIHGTPYTYIIKSMFGPSNFENASSINYINEMKPLVPISNLGFIVFSIILITFLTFVPSKIKTEHGFLLVGLMLMSLTSVRYTYLLVFIGAYVLVDLISQTFNLLIKDDVAILEKIFSSIPGACILIILISIYSTSAFLERAKTDYVNTNLYPVEATNFIKNHLDYKNIRIYNSYNIGSYLMLNDIPVFIDSRLDVYCSEFNDTDIFYDFVQTHFGYKHYSEAFEKYDFTHILFKHNDVPNQYIKGDSNYKKIHEDKNFVLYEKLNSK